MRLVSVVGILLLLSGLAAAQATIMAGTASNWAPAYGVYLAPYVPLVTTPSATLATVSPSPVGASNATSGLVAGATNSTLSSEFVGQPPVGVYSTPVWYGPSASPEVTAEPTGEVRHEHRARAFDFQIAAQTQGAAQLMSLSSPARKASRSYSNQDIDQLQPKTGVVKYRGKTERL